MISNLFTQSSQLMLPAERQPKCNAKAVVEFPQNLEKAVAARINKAARHNCTSSQQNIRSVQKDWPRLTQSDSNKTFFQLCLQKNGLYSQFCLALAKAQQHVPKAFALARTGCLRTRDRGPVHPRRWRLHCGMMSVA